jgi:hypothetical protein
MSNELELETLVDMMEKFVLGGDRSLAYANQMEALTVGPLRGDRRLEDFQGALAAYRPGGGDFLLDEEALSFACREALHDLGRHRFCKHA